MIDPYKQATYLDRLPKLLFRNARAIIAFTYHLCSSFNLVEKLIVTLFYCFVDLRRLKKVMLFHEAILD